MSAQEQIRLLFSRDPPPKRNPAHNPQSLLGGLLKKLHVPCGRSSNCSHSFGCIQWILRESTQAAICGYVVKIALETIFAWRSLSSQPSILLKMMKGRNSLGMGLIAGISALLHEAINCILKRMVRGERQRLIPWLAGALSSAVAYRLLQKPMRKGFLLFLLASSINLIYKQMLKREYVPEWRYFSTIVYSLCMILAASNRTHSSNIWPVELKQNQVRDLAKASKGLFLSITCWHPSLPFPSIYREFYRRQS